MKAKLIKAVKAVWAAEVADPNVKAAVRTALVVATAAFIKAFVGA